jgi:predicted DCC family thiol-disulfide oxidoreductase YuxK
VLEFGPFLALRYNSLVKCAIQVASPPTKPVMVFDGDCNFCMTWIRRWERTTGDRVDYLPFQDASISQRFPEIPRSQFESAVQLIVPDGSVYGGAEAAFRALACVPGGEWFLDWYTHSPAFARAAEWGYRRVAANRRFFSFLTRLGWGRNIEPPSQLLVRWVFLRSLALIYLIAFVSLWHQMGGLIGSNGILPAKMTMQAANKMAAATGLGMDRYHQIPTLCWFSSSDRFLSIQCASGVTLGLLVLFGIAPAPCLFLLWLIYLSLATVGREFFGFQWDNLLLETGFLAIFFAPLQWLPRTGHPAPPSRIVIWLLRLLLFRLMFESGCVKLLSRDPVWHDLSALNFHYETQPLPTWLGWYAHQLPVWWQKTSVALMFGIELVIPFLIFGPRRFRHLAFAPLVGFQVCILLTGNYCFFNLLTIVLCLTLLDDAALRWLSRFKPRIWPWTRQPLTSEKPARRHIKWPRPLTIPLACVSIVISLLQLSLMFQIPIPWPRPLVAIQQWLSPLRSFNSYGLFAVMTTSRPEIIIEGSNDGITWLAYEFKYKAGNLEGRPGFVAPHQPRLDWQMWFAALGNYQQNPWLLNFFIRLLQGSPEVLALLQHNPFPAVPPRYIRAVMYDYHFTTLDTHRKTGAWWRRDHPREYLPTISLESIQRQ